MSALKNDRLLKAIAQQPVDRTPIWIMRQAGRYLPEYRATRARAGSFMKLCQTPELACEVTLQPLARYPLDAAIIFSDILTIPDAMGLGLHFIEGSGPQFAKSLAHEADILSLTPPDSAELAYVYDAIRLVKDALHDRVPLIGFCGSPWTLAVYMLEGRSRPGFPKAMAMLNQAPHLLHRLLSVLAESVAMHLQQQIIAGADVVMLFDTWGGLLTTPHYQAFSLHYLQKVIAALPKHHQDRKVPVILFTKHGQAWLEPMAGSGCDVLGVDWEVTLKEARRRVGSAVALQGNLNPSCLLQSETAIREAVANVLADYGSGSGHIFNLGHGITPDVPPDNVAVLVDAVHTLSEPYHQALTVTS